jgi:S-adenosylmethionine-diacylgycerolhomoserine-N-methlytransferase
MAGRINVALGDASKFSGEQLFGVAHFDRVFISYALSMIPPWREALREAYEAVAPGGSLHIVDFGEQSGLPSLFRKGLRAWLIKFHVEPRAELEDELKQLAERTGARLRLERPYRDYARLGVLEKP